MSWYVLGYTTSAMIIKKLPYDLSSHAGLAFIGKYLRQVRGHRQVRRQVRGQVLSRYGVRSCNQANP